MSLQLIGILNERPAQRWRGRDHRDVAQFMEKLSLPLPSWFPAPNMETPSFFVGRPRTLTSSAFPTNEECSLATTPPISLPYLYRAATLHPHHCCGWNRRHVTRDCCFREFDAQMCCNAVRILRVYRIAESNILFSRESCEQGLDLLLLFLVLSFFVRVFSTSGRK